MSDWLNLAQSSLACYRLAQLFAFDEGPLSLFQRLRAAAGGYTYDKQGRAKTGLGRMATCPYCLGMWIAIPLAIFATRPRRSLIIRWLAIAGGQSFLQGLSDDH